MTAEHISLKQYTSHLDGSKSVKANSSGGRSSDFFSEHLTAKLDNFDASEQSIERRRARETDAQTRYDQKNDERSQSRSNDDRLAANRAEDDRAASDRAERKRNEKADEAEKKSERRDAEAADEERKNQAINNELSQTQPSTDPENTGDSDTVATSEQDQNQQDLLNNGAIEVDALSEAKPDVDEAQELGAELIAATLGQTEAQQGAAALQKNSALENAKAPIFQQQTAADDTNLTALQNTALSQKDGLGKNFVANLESTLGTDGIDGEGSESAEILDNKLTKLAQQDGKSKEGGAGIQNQASGQNGAQIGAQNSAQNPAALANQLLADITAKGRDGSSSRLSLANGAQADGAEITGTVNNNAEAKTLVQQAQVQSPRPTTPTQSIAIQIAQKAQNGVKQFEIRLNPPELGRVDVRLEFSKDGKVNTHLIVEKAETLDLLNKDARQLERALNDAGLNFDDEGLSFSLKDQQQNESDEKRFGDRDTIAIDEGEEEPVEIQTNHRINLDQGLDISV